MKTCILALTLCLPFGSAALAQAAMPPTLIGAWCGIANEGRRLDVARTGYEEGDGVCTVGAASLTAGDGLSTYAVRFICDTGVEKRKPAERVERFTLLRNETEQLIYRQGSLYEPKLTAIYRRCKS